MLALPPLQDDPTTPQTQLLPPAQTLECPGAPRKPKARRVLPLSPRIVRRLGFDDAPQGGQPQQPPPPGGGGSGGKAAKLRTIR